MASPVQPTANRLNAQHSTGARTAAPPVAPHPLTTTQAEVAHAPRRQAASSRNAVRHNLSPGATFTLLPGENLAAFEKLARDYRDEFQPRTAHEAFLVNQMIQAQWRMSRIERLQAEVLDKILNAPVADGKSDEAAIVAAMGFAHGDILDRLERYGRAAERAYFRANKELKQYRAQKQNEAKPALPISDLARPACDRSRRGLPQSVSGHVTPRSPFEQNEPNPRRITVALKAPAEAGSIHSPNIDALAPSTSE